MANITRLKNCSDDARISKIIHSVLTQVFGEEATHLIYRYLESKCSLNRFEIPAKIDVFAEGLEEFLRSGAYVVEQKILEDIYSSYDLIRGLELKRVHEEHDFVDQMRLLAQKT